MLLKELVETNPLLAKIEGEAQNMLIEEVKQKVEAEEKKMEDRKQNMTDIILDDGGTELTLKDKPHILSASVKKGIEEAEKAKNIHKKHKEKLKKVKPGFNRKNINPAFFSNAKASANNKQGWALDFDSVKDNEFSKITTESEAKLMKKRLEEEKLMEDKKKTIKESDILILDKENRDKFLTEGEYVYELFAILTHSGNVNDAHYYAHIKDAGTDNWFDYNDTQVRPMRISEIQNAFGGFDFRSKFIVTA